MKAYFNDPRITLSKALKQIGIVEKDAIVIALDAGSSQTIVDNQYLQNNFMFTKETRTNILELITKFYSGRFSDN